MSPGVIRNWKRFAKAGATTAVRILRARYNRKRIRRVMQLHGLMLAPRVHRRH